MTTRPVTIALLLATLLLAVAPLASSQQTGDVTVQSIEAVAAGQTAAVLAGLLIDHQTPDQPVAASGLTLDAPDAVVISNYVAAKVGGTNAGSTPRTVQDGGPAIIRGVESRPDLHFWITPLSSGATIEIQHRACTTLQPPLADQEVRRPVLGQEASTITVDTDRTAAVASCADAVAVVRGDLSIVAWEWDMLVNGERVDSGVNDTTAGYGLPATGAGSADELTITARDATLTIPLTAATYELFLFAPQVEARELHLTDARGTLPGILDDLDGEDVDLVGDYAVTLDASTTPFTATVTGTTSQASAGGQPLDVQVPPPGGQNDVVLRIVMGLLVAGVAVVSGVSYYRRPLVALHLNPGAQLDKKPETHREQRSAGFCILADADLKRGRLQRARRRARRASRLDPENARSLFILGGTLLRQQDLDLALSAYVVAHDRAQTDRLRCLAVMGEAEVHALRGDEDKASDALLLANRIDATRAAKAANSEIWDHFPLQGVVALVRSGRQRGTNPDYHQ